MNKLDTYNTNAKLHKEMLLEMNQSLKITESNNRNSIHIKPSRDNLSNRFLLMLADVIDNNLQFLLFQATKRSESLLEIDRKEAIEESKNFINNHGTKHG